MTWSQHSRASGAGLPQGRAPRASVRTGLPAVHRRRLVAGLRLIALLHGRLVGRPPAVAAPAALRGRRSGCRARDAIVRRLIVRACCNRPRRFCARAWLTHRADHACQLCRSSSRR